MPETLFLALTLADTLDWAWYLLSVVVFFAALFMIGLILLQDSKDSGLTSAFGGGGSSSLMGARMQKDLAKLTGILAAVLTFSLFTMGVITAKSSGRTAGETDSLPPPAETKPAIPPTGVNPLDGLLPGGGITPAPGGITPTPGGITPAPGGITPAPGGVPPTPGAGTPAPVPVPAPAPGSPPAGTPTTGGASATPSVPPAPVPAPLPGPAPAPAPTPTPGTPPAGQ